MLRKLAERTQLKAVCLAGGGAFNCVANGKIFDATPFEQVYVHPAAGDAGLAVGAALYVWQSDPRQASRVRDGTCILGTGIFDGTGAAYGRASSLASKASRLRNCMKRN